MLFCQVFHSKIPRQVECLVGWFLGIALVVSAVYSVYTSYKEDSRSFNKAENIIYGTFRPFVWGLALAGLSMRVTRVMEVSVSHVFQSSKMQRCLSHFSNNQINLRIY